LEFSVKFYVNSPISNFMKICSAVLRFTCGQTDEPSDMGNLIGTFLQLLIENSPKGYLGSNV
jgi:hypothetical protein